MKTYNIKETATRIRKLRISSGFTQEATAEQIGVERSYLSRIETGASGCSVDILIRFSELYHVSLDYLIYGKATKRVDVQKRLTTVIQQLSEIRDLM